MSFWSLGCLRCSYYLYCIDSYFWPCFSQQHSQHYFETLNMTFHQSALICADSKAKRWGGSRLRWPAYQIHASDQGYTSCCITYMLVLTCWHEKKKTKNRTICVHELCHDLLWDGVLSSDLQHVMSETMNCTNLCVGAWSQSSALKSFTATNDYYYKNSPIFRLFLCAKKACLIY